MTDARLCLSVRVPAEHASVIADVLRLWSFPDRPCFVRRDRDRLRLYWLVEVHGRNVFDRPPSRVIPMRWSLTAEYVGRVIAPVIADLFIADRFDPRWTLKAAA